VGYKGGPGQRGVTHLRCGGGPEPDLLWEIVRETKSPKPFLQEAGSLLS
jgi:hypothetical protein